jgi:Type IV secretion system pilin
MALMDAYRDSGFALKGQSVGGIISIILPYVFVVAGLTLLIMLILGGIQLMTSAGDPDKTKLGYGRITHALIGFLIVFIAYFVTELVQVMLGMNFLGG